MAYLAAVLTIVYLDHSSEVTKLARGAYTDTFRPPGLARAAAWPDSYLGPVAVYPDDPFDATSYRPHSSRRCTRASERRSSRPSWCS